ncbi:hypothetical protein [Microcoleus sp. CAWBG24]|uniref:hypothetical protein n=1 Tax=Microcoleus sp. CAWBG24 TaxID=2841644 RepID=UPI0025CBA3C5|nr:hypothetical protein [Microcoleus sp. CAWBG24]
MVIYALICSIAPVDKTAANLPPGAPLENPNPARDCLGQALDRSRRHIALQGETLTNLCLKARGFLLRRDSDEFTLCKHLDRMPYGCKSST